MGYTHTNLTHCFLATGVERIEKQQLDNGEDIQVRIFNRDEVMDMLRNGEMLRKFLKGAEEEIYFSNY